MYISIVLLKRTEENGEPIEMSLMFSSFPCLRLVVLLLYYTLYTTSEVVNDIYNSTVDIQAEIIRYILNSNVIDVIG